MNQTTSTGSTPLHAACHKGHLQIVTYLVEHEANMEGANEYQQTPLMVAAHMGKADVVEYLLSVNASADCEDQHGCTALHEAASSGDEKTVKFMIAAGVEFKNNHNGHSPKSVATNKGHKHLLPLLEKLLERRE